MLLDTNVLSECMRPRPAMQVLAWLDAHHPYSLYTSAVSRAEIELGLALIEVDFAGRCLPFNDQAASHYARLVAARTSMGRPISVEDAQIAAIALAHGMLLVTRNTADFERIEGLEVVNPWGEQQFSF